MTNFKGPGKTLTLTAPYAVLSNDGALCGPIFGVANTDIASGVDGDFDTEGEFVLKKTSAQAWVKWDLIYWDAANKKCDNTAGVGPLIGVALAAAANPSATGRLKLLPNAKAGSGSGIYNQRFHVPIASVNAGLTLLAALAGFKYRLIACSAIAVGGAAGTGTTVDILATQAAAGVKLVAYAQAGLVRSAVLKDGGANAAVLADGASYVDNDVNTAITIGKTGAAFDTATFIDINLTYAID